MRKALRLLIEASTEGLVYDIVCHAFAALVAWHVITGAPASVVAALGTHLDTAAAAVSANVDKGE
jgi:hypothetical protein